MRSELLIENSELSFTIIKFIEFAKALKSTIHISQFTAHLLGDNNADITDNFNGDSSGLE